MRYEIYKVTTDDWYPSYTMKYIDTKFVKVSISQTGPNPPESGE
jgi:hypothetical protein